MFLKVWTQNVLQEWVKVFAEILRKYANNTNYNFIDQSFSITLLLSEPDQPTISRLIAAKMIGYIAEAIGDKVKPLLERARALC